MKHQETTKNPTAMPLAGPILATGAIDTETLELLESWAREDATDDPKALSKAQNELDEFKKSINENRASSGERILYP